MWTNWLLRNVSILRIYVNSVVPAVCLVKTTKSINVKKNRSMILRRRLINGPDNEKRVICESLHQASGFWELLSLQHCISKKTKDCSRSWIFQHKSSGLCLVLWCLPLSSVDYGWAYKVDRYSSIRLLNLLLQANSKPLWRNLVWIANSNPTVSDTNFNILFNDVLADKIFWRMNGNFFLFVARHVACFSIFICNINICSLSAASRRLINNVAPDCTFFNECFFFYLYRCGIFCRYRGQ